MNGYGPFATPLLRFALYWGMAAILLAIVTNLFWVRGMETGGGPVEARPRAFLGPERRRARCVDCSLRRSADTSTTTRNVVNPYRTTFTIQEARAQYENEVQAVSRRPAAAGDRCESPMSISTPTSDSPLSRKRVAGEQDGRADRARGMTIWPEDVDVIPRPHIEVRS